MGELAKQIFDAKRGWLGNQAAVLLARDNRLRLHVFSFDHPDAMYRLCQGEDVGTLIANVEHDVLA